MLIEYNECSVEQAKLELIANLEDEIVRRAGGTMLLDTQGSYLNTENEWI